MIFEELLKGRKCSCGMFHSCDIKKVIIGSGAMKELKNLAEDYKNILLVADTNTYQVCGKAAEGQIVEKLENTLIYKREGLLVPDEKAIEEMQEKLTDRTDLIIGVGSGVIQDLCKHVSFRAGLPYFIVATAPSMDGYASKGAAMIIGNMKITYNAHVPQAIIGDTDILKEAPLELIQSGYGDIVGKYSCLNDWKLSKVINGEYFCEYVYNLTFEMLCKTKDVGEKLLKRDEEAIGTLMEALVGVGIAMAYVGNSRPASGSEHHLSHYFEVVGIMNDEPYFMHGTDVLFSAVYTQKIREKLLHIQVPEHYKIKDMEVWEENIRRVYGTAAEGVLALQNRLGWYETDRYPVYLEKWHQIREVLKEVPSSEELIGYVKSIGLDMRQFERLYGKKNTRCHMVCKGFKR